MRSFSSLAGLLLCVLCVAPARAVPLTEEGRPVARIVVAQRAGPATVAAAAELAEYLAKMSGAELPVVRDAPRDGDALLGTVAEWPDLPEADEVRALGPEGYVMRTDGRQLLLLAHDDLAVRHVVVSFLEHLGCRWFYPGEVWEEVPLRPTVLVADLDVADKPTMGYRRIWYGHGHANSRTQADYEAWSRHNKQGGHITGGVGHAYSGIINPREFEAHPDWFALVNGKRVPNGQLCTSNPEVIERARDYVRRQLRENPSLKMVSLSPNDGRGYCECPACQAEGGISDRTLLLCNRVAEAIETEFPDKWVAMYAYAGNSAPPTLDGHPQVIIFIATSFITRGWTVEELIEGWSAHVRQLGIRDYYCVDIWTRDVPRWQVDALAERIPYYHSRNVVGINAEASCNWGAEGVNYYVGARIQWNVNADVDAVLDNYYEKCWGPAGEAMRRYHARWKDAPGGAGRVMATTRVLTLSSRDLADALEAARGNASVLARVRQMLKYQHWLWLFRRHATAPPKEAQTRGWELVRWTFGITDTGMVHSKAMYRDKRIFGGPWLSANQEEWAPLWGNVDPITDEEAEAAFQADLEELPEIMDLRPVKTSGPLEPLSVEPAPNSRPASPIYRGGGRFFVQGRGPGPTVMRVSTGHIRKHETTLTYAPAAQLDDWYAPFEPVAPAQTLAPGEHTVELPLRDGELYVLDFVSAGGSGVKVDFGERPHAWVMGHHGHIISGTRGDLAVYVPAGTTGFAVAIATSDGWGRVTVRAPTGAVAMQREGNYVTGGEFAVEVPPEHAGRVWRVAIDKCEDANRFHVVGIPPLAAHDSRWLLRPAPQPR